MGYFSDGADSVCACRDEEQQDEGSLRSGEMRCSDLTLTFGGSQSTAKTRAFRHLVLALRVQDDINRRSAPYIQSPASSAFGFPDDSLRELIESVVIII